MKRMTRTQLQVRACERQMAHIDDQPHMTLTPEKDGKLWRDGKHGLNPNQKQHLLSAREAFNQGFHIGARWAFAFRRTR